MTPKGLGSSQRRLEAPRGLAGVVGHVESKFDLPGGARVNAMLDSTLDVLARVVVRERERGQDQRY